MPLMTKKRSMPRAPCSKGSMWSVVQYFLSIPWRWASTTSMAARPRQTWMLTIRLDCLCGACGKDRLPSHYCIVLGADGVLAFENRERRKQQRLNTGILHCVQDDDFKRMAGGQGSSWNGRSQEQATTRTGNDLIRGSFTAFRMTTSKTDDDVKRIAARQGDSWNGR